MKKIKFIIVAAVLLFAIGTVSAQDKFAYINAAELLQAMPEMDTITKKFEKYGADLAETFEEMQAEYSKKVIEYTEKGKEWSEVMQNQKSKELSSLAESIQLFEESAQEEMSKKRQELMGPVYQRVNDAISAVGKEKGFTFIFDISSSGGAIVFVNEDTATNATQEVKTKLGL